MEKATEWHGTYGAWTLEEQRVQLRHQLVIRFELPNMEVHCEEGRQYKAL